jgi:hypothetical protein
MRGSGLLTRFLSLSLLAVLATACPVTPDKPLPKVGGPQGEGPQGEGMAREGGPPPGGEGKAPGGGQEIGISLKDLKGQQTQEELAQGEHVTISGEVTGTCSGTLRLDIIEVEASVGGGGGSKPLGPLTTIELKGPGPFKGVAPRGKNIIVSALCDENGDGRVAAPDDNVAFGSPIGVTDKDRDGIELKLQPFPKGISPSGGKGEGGMDKKGPPPGGEGGMDKKGPPPGGEGGMDRKGPPPGGKGGAEGKPPPGNR